MIERNLKKILLREFINSLKSSNESKFWLIILRDANKCDKTEANYLLKELTEISKIIAKSVKTLRKRIKK